MTHSPDFYLKLAEEAAHNAYAPYSKFKVGSVVVTETGEVFQGCNVENVSFGLTICAERNAIFQAVAACGPKMRIQAIYIAMAEGKYGAPCGACRQVIAEFGHTAEIYFRTKDHLIKTIFEELLPHTFEAI